MQNLNILTWNSTGETPQGAAALQKVINDLTSGGWHPNLIVIQEANAAPGGPIYQMLASLTGYNQPPAHAAEGGTAGRGYILLTSGVSGQGTFTQANLANDSKLKNWISNLNNLSLAASKLAQQELPTMHMPATATLNVGGKTISFLTWHAPLGPGPVLAAGTLPGGANPDAFLFLQNSDIYQKLTNSGTNIGIIAGDLNVTVAGLKSTGIPIFSEVLRDFVGVSDNLDHIVGYSTTGGTKFTFSNDGHHVPDPKASPHNILVSTVSF
jgi:hypothetical protein